MDPSTLYDRVGGQPFFDELVAAFYHGVEGDNVLRPMYPSDLAEPRRRLALFLAQYWGGPPTYSAERGHPRLRLRHAPFPITSDARDRWLVHMAAALAGLADRLSEDDRSSLEQYLVESAGQLRNI